MLQQKQFIEIGFLRKQVKKLEEWLIGLMFHQEKCMIYQRKCSMQLEYQVVREKIIIENFISTFMV